jgi:hypothetical protein
MTAIPDHKTWRLEVVRQIHQLASQMKLEVNRSLLVQLQSLLPQSSTPNAIPILQPTPFPVAPTLTWRIPFDPDKPLNAKPGYATSKAARDFFTQLHRDYAKHAKVPTSFSDTKRKVSLADLVSLETSLILGSLWDSLRMG